MNWGQIFTNIAAAGAAGGIAGQLPIPPKYSWVIPAITGIAGILAGLFQKQPHVQNQSDPTK